MKVCLQCAHENEDDASSCQRCRHREFGPAAPPTTPHEILSSEAPPSPEFLTAEKEGNLTVLRCRTLEEAFLVAEELEAADILAILPDEAAMLSEFQNQGFVSIQISAQSYEAAKELQTVIERQHWQERAQQPLSIPMIMAAVALGLLFCPGGAFFFMVNDAYKAKGYRRKAKSFRRWFFVGFALFFCVAPLLPNLLRLMR